MNAAAIKIPTAAAAILYGVGCMQQASTQVIPFRNPYSMEDLKSFRADLFFSSVIQFDFMEMRLMGEENYLRIQEISRLKYGWDGYKARPIPLSVINRTKALLMLLPGGARVVPTARSTVQIEYHRDNGNYFELEISTRAYEFYCVNGDEEIEGRVSKREIKKRVEDFLV